VSRSDAARPGGGRRRGPGCGPGRAGVKKIYDDSTLSYDGLRYNGPGVKPITPNDQFYVVTKNVIDPNPTKATWRLTVDGAVEKPRTYDFDDIASMPSVEQEMTLACISNAVGAALVSNAVWKGTPLRNLLDDVGPKSGVMDILVHAADGYTHDVRFEKIMEETTILAYEMNGEPLPSATATRSAFWCLATTARGA
jgi:DMSO/TMAO reductase YedYZ molybdopterin-dependent catalytic subunit